MNLVICHVFGQICLYKYLVQYNLAVFIIRKQQKWASMFLLKAFSSLGSWQNVVIFGCQTTDWNCMYLKMYMYTKQYNKNHYKILVKTNYAVN